MSEEAGVRGEAAGTRGARANPALAVVAVYLMATLPPFFIGPGGVLRNVVLVVHLALALGMARAVGWLPGRRDLGLGRGVFGQVDEGEAATRRWAWLRLWTPILFFPVLYLEVPLLHSAPADELYRDGIVQGWELALFPGNPSRTLAADFNGLLWVEPASALYLLALLAPVVLAVVFSRGERATFRDWSFGPVLSWAVVLLVAVYFPVLGPRYGMFAAEDIAGGLLRAGVWQLLLVISSPGTAFPALVAAVGVSAALGALRAGRVRLGLSAVTVVVLGSLASVHGGFHYGVSILAGLALGVAAQGVARAVASRAG